MYTNNYSKIWLSYCTIKMVQFFCFTVSGSPLH